MVSFTCYAKLNGWGRKDSLAALKPRLASPVELGRNRIAAEDGGMDTSETLAGKRDRAPVVVVDISEDPQGSMEKRCRVGDLHFAFAPDTEEVKEHTLWWNPVLEARCGATHVSAVEGTGAAIFA